MKSSYNDVMVSVLCAAYNHEKFIKDTIEGVINQKTDFKYELIIHDDASTDGTAQIIRKYEEAYPEIIKPIYQSENQFKKCKILPTFLFPKVTGKYIALCEGDDYWIDENKLQKQIDFLEEHKDYSMCIHNAIKLNVETGEKKLLNPFKQTGTYSQREQIAMGLGTDFPAFASYVLRAELLKDMPSFFVEASVLDYPLRQYYASKGKVYYFEEPMSVYRAMTPLSRMRTFSKDQEAYNNYTLGMIRFYEQFNQYTEEKDADLLNCKIESDYLGFCVSCEKERGIQKALDQGMDMEMIYKCYDCISDKYIERETAQLREQSKHIFIYGTSRLAAVCKRQLEDCGIEFEGFVVSDSQMKSDTMEGKEVYYLSEVVAKYDNPGFILAVQPVNMNVIVGILEENDIKNYCKPYMVKL